MITQKELTHFAENNKNALIEFEGKGKKHACFVTSENQETLTNLIENGKIKVGGIDKVEYSKDSEYFEMKDYQTVLKEGVAIMWAGNGDLYINPGFSNKIKGEGEPFVVPENKSDGLSPEGKAFLEENGLSTYPVAEFRKMLPVEGITGGENKETVVQAPSSWGSDATQTAQYGAFVNVTENWETGKVEQVYIINPDENENPIGFSPVNGSIEKEKENSLSLISKNKESSSIEVKKKNNSTPKR